MDFTDITWPPQVTIKKHPRARHVKIKATLKQGIELVVPNRFNQKEIPFILEQNRLWIEKQLKKLQAQAAIVKPDELPVEIIFAAINQTWRVSYIAAAEKTIKLITRPHQEIVLFGDIDNKALCKKLLVMWAKYQARKYLPQQLKLISAQTKLAFTKVTIRNQTSRWGSCSATKSINLNYKLIFLPPAFVQHILLHELCHTVHLNHSAKFWQLVAMHDANWEEHRRLIRKGDDFIPGWVS